MRELAITVGVVLVLHLPLIAAVVCIWHIVRNPKNREFVSVAGKVESRTDFWRALSYEVGDEHAGAICDAVDRVCRKRGIRPELLMKIGSPWYAQGQSAAKLPEAKK